MNSKEVTGVYAIIDGKSRKVQGVFTSVDGKTHEAKVLCTNDGQKIAL
jgi:hypothetical protein